MCNCNGITIPVGKDGTSITIKTVTAITGGRKITFSDGTSIDILDGVTPTANDITPTANKGCLVFQGNTLDDYIGAIITELCTIKNNTPTTPTTANTFSTLVHDNIDIVNTGYIPFVNEVYDYGNNHSAGVYTAPTTGNYEFYLQDLLLVSNLGGHTVKIVKVVNNGSPIVLATSSTPISSYSDINLGNIAIFSLFTGNISLNAGDTIRIQVVDPGGQTTTIIKDSRFFGGKI